MTHGLMDFESTIQLALSHLYLLVACSCELSAAVPVARLHPSAAERLFGPSHIVPSSYPRQIEGDSCQNQSQLKCVIIYSKVKLKLF